jgi:hypothetical protein
MSRVVPEQLELEAARLEPPPPETSESNQNARNDSAAAEGSRSATHRPSATDLLGTPGALLTRSHLRGLGLERRAIDAVFRTLPVIALPGYSRPMISAEAFLELVTQHTYRGDRVRPCS